MTRLFSDARRPVHLGPFPAERLARRDAAPDLSCVPPMRAIAFNRPDAPDSIVNAMRDYQAMLDVIRDGPANPARAEIPADPAERARHLKAFGMFCDSAMVGICRLPAAAVLAEPVANPDIARLSRDLQTRQTKTLASGIDMIMADLKDSAAAPPSGIDGHSHAIVYLYENPRPPAPGEAGCDWLDDALEARAAAKGEVGVRLGDDGEDAARAFRHTDGFKGQAGHDGAGDLFQQRHLADHIVGGRAVRQGAGTIAGGGVFQRFEAGAHALADGNVGAEIAAAGGDRRLAHGDEAVGVIRQGKGSDHRTA